MPNHTGLSPESPNKYLGANVYLAVEVTRNREPTGADYRQPETGKLYPFGSFWIVGKNPTTGVQGDLWYLSKIVANVGYWIKLSTGTSGPLDAIQVQAVTAPGVNPVEPTNSGIITFNGAIVAAHSVPIETRTRALNTLNVEVQQASAVASTTASQSGLAHFRSSQFTVDGNGFVSLVGGTGPTTLTMSDDIGALVSPSGSGNIQLQGRFYTSGPTAFHTTIAGTNLIRSNPMTSVRWIVDPLSFQSSTQFNGTHQTITAACASASSGDVIIIMPGTYTENFTIPSGVTLIGYSWGSVNIIGKITQTAGVSFVYDCTLTTNSDYVFESTGSTSRGIEMYNCNITMSSGNGFHITGSNAYCNLNFCIGDVTNASFTYHVLTGGSISYIHCRLGNSASSSVSSSNANSGVTSLYSMLSVPMSCSGTGSFFLERTRMVVGTNSTCITTTGTAQSFLQWSEFNSGNQPAISAGVGTTVGLRRCYILSSNTNALTGAGNIQAADLNFNGTHANNVTGFTCDAQQVGSLILQNSVQISSGTGDPNGVVTAPQGSLFLRTDGAGATSLYINTDGATTWSAR